MGDARPRANGLVNANKACMRISFDTLHLTLSRCLLLRGFSEPRARQCAYILAENNLVGVESHGLNRFPRFLEWIDRGWVIPEAVAERITSHGGMEQWDGNLGPGPLNAQDAMARAVTLSQTSGIGCVALRNTNHWMRAGTYAWQAASAGCLGICFTNTEPNLPPWGSAIPKLGNNPIALSVPRENGQHVLFDGALSQFSYGALERAARHRELLPVPGGFSTSGRLTSDPTEILQSQRALPIGYWKGAGLSLLLDLFATVLSSGQSTYDLGQQPSEHGVSQVLLAFSHAWISADVRSAIERSLADLHATRCIADDESVTYPGERLQRRRTENLRLGVPVDPKRWRQVVRASA